jgi:predicted PolB exonuclease-like 3'-5' exonuclease
VICLDIETVPTDAAMQEPYPEATRNPPGNFSKADTIAAWREKDKAAWQEERVVCLGITQGDTVGCIEANTEAKEIACLNSFWVTVANNADGRIVTWNGIWDLRFLVVRSLLHGLVPSINPMTVREWFRKYTTHPHFDVKALLTNWDAPKAGEGLDEWAKAFGIAGKSGLTGADVYPLYQIGHFEEIAAYCRQDVETTLALYNRIKDMFS